ncbi:glycoside hydrolase family 95 protein [Lacisediminihabitans changchengi]|uniref:Glycoside hydrolase family 95 protein n=1 Tax=Lacisediminihabitans changchengi TaxID=2787634 RepID=A0A934VWX5_9MICO|nr:glycoside hydrolase family 95 protein [Lacisediminihabitans changchengi]MBK4346277.1 glycoside hydrolase family 95 protein [Lacisediminihabitans changchengi]
MPADTLRLFWPTPAEEWVEAAPIGNGRLGAMVFGGATSARWQINDGFAWSGSPDGPAVALAERTAAGAGPERLAEVRSAIDARDYRRAESLLLDLFEARWSQEFLPFVDLTIDVTSPGDSSYGGRELDLDDGVVTERFRVGDVPVMRRSWASRPAQAMCVEIVAEAPLDLRIALGSGERIRHRAASDGVVSLGVELPVDGAPLHEESAVDRRYAAAVDAERFDPFAVAALAADTDGELTTGNDVVTITGATRVLLTLSSSTNAEHWWHRDGRDVGRSATDARVAEAESRASAALAVGAERLLADHRSDLGGLLGGTSLTIGKRRSGRFEVATDVLRSGDDRLVATVMFQFGRYLLASSSRPGGPPANLQGIWNDQQRPPWSSNYTININTQMNYWGAELAGLSETHLPLFDLIQRVAENGTAVAAELYGANGWVAHHNTDLWGWALPVGAGHGDVSWAFWPMGGMWLATHLWTHYEATLDREFLECTALPLLRGATEFALSWLTEDGAGRLRTIPSTSPENLFIGPDGHRESLGSSTAMDISLIRRVFADTIATATVLGLQDDLTARITRAIPLLPAPAITAGGWLQEWAEDYEELNPAHRHISQVVALFPLGQIHPEGTPELAEAARQLLDRRGSGAMGWSWAWKMALRARLGDGEAVRSLLLEATRPYERDLHALAEADGGDWGGLAPNLFSTHPPVQLDGNYGFIVGIAATVVQGERGVVRLLPALPEAWSEGSVRGIRLPGAVSIDVEWAAGELVRASLVHTAGGAEPVRVTYRGAELSLLLSAEPIELSAYDFALVTR